jgi:hypothetical protein
MMFMVKFTLATHGSLLDEDFVEMMLIIMTMKIRVIAPFRNVGFGQDDIFLCQLVRG